MGPIVKWGSNGSYTGFLTNGHCTNSYWGNSQAATAYWSTHAVMTGLGNEYANPQPITCPSNVIAADHTGTPTCRYSEAALVLLGVSANFGYVTKTSSLLSNTVSGSITVVDSAPSPIEGEVMAYTGHVRGVNQGLVYLDAVDVRIQAHKFVLNSVWVEGDTAAHGDSGGPVWTAADNNFCVIDHSGCNMFAWPTAVHLAGIIFAQSKEPGHFGWFFSGITNIMDEIGDLRIRDAVSGDGGPLVASSLLATYPTYANETHGYSLYASGGTLPFTCDWSIDYSVVATGASCTDWEYHNGSSDFNVSVVLHDAASHSTSGAVNVYIYSCNPPEDECVMDGFQRTSSREKVGRSGTLERRLLGLGAVVRTTRGPGTVFDPTPRIWRL